MGLFDMFKKKAEPAAAAAPASISASAGADVLCSPVKGKVIKIQKVPAQNVPYAINHTDGVMSVGVGAGIHVVIGPFGFSIH